MSKEKRKAERVNRSETATLGCQFWMFATFRRLFAQMTACWSF